MPDSNAQESKRATGSRDRDRDRDHDDGDSFLAEWNNDLICGSR
jgi:hypothetical protein